MSGPDLLDPALRVAGTAHRVSAKLRAENGPVVWQGARRPGFWAVLGWSEARTVLSSPERFTSTRGTRPGMQRPAGALLPLHNLDPPEHTPVRRQAQGLLTRVDVAIEAATAELVAGLAGRTVDGVEDIAIPLATRALTAALGLDGDAGAQLAHLSLRAHAAAAVVLEHYPDVEPARQRDAKRASQDLFERIAQLLANSPELGRRLAPARAQMLMQLMVQAGLVTAVDGIAGGLAILAERGTVPRDDSALAVEELLRLVSPINQFARTAVTECELGGQRIAAGAQVVVFFGAANRDPRQFSDPDRAILDRTPNRHIAFGCGPHACPGASLTRTQLRALVRGLSDAGAAPHLADAPVRRRSAFLNGFDRLPLTFV